MYTTMIAAISTDGFIAGQSGDQSWISAEDKAFLRQTIKEHDVLIMGSGTFLAHIDSFNPKSTKTRVVLTSKPNDFKEYAGLASFKNKNIAGVMHELEKSGHKNVLILGGARLYTECLDKGFTDEILLTIEPLKLGVGTPFLNNNMSIHSYRQYKKVSTEKINNSDTVLIRFLSTKI